MYLLYDLYLIAGKQLSLEPHGMRDGASSLPVIWEGKNKTVDVSHLLDAVVFSYVCILKFLFQLNDCMRKNCIFNRWKIKFGKFESLVSVAVSQWKMNEEKEVRRFRLTAVRKQHDNTNAVGTGVWSRAEVTWVSQFPYTCERANKQKEDWFMIDWQWEQ